VRALLEDMKSGEVAMYDVPVPELQRGGILVRTAFSAISAGTEKATVEAGKKSLLGKALARPDLVKQVMEYARSNGLRAAHQKVQARLDTLTALGYSCAGFVLGAGHGVSEFQPGDRVACAGAGYASHCEVNFVPANLAVRVPANVSLEAASLTTIGAIAIQGVRQANVTFGETVAVIGVGLVGVLAIQVLRAAGCRVIAIDLSAERAAQATSLGAHIGLSTNDPGLESAVVSFSRYGVDAALITAATRSADPLELAAKLLRDRGRISVIGDVGMGVSRANMYRKEISLSMSRSYGPGRYDPLYEEGGQDYPIGYVRWTEKRNMESFLDLLSSGAVQVEALLAKRFAVEDGGKAYTAVEAGAYTSIIDYHAPEHGPASASAPVTRQTAQPCSKDKLRVGCIGTGGFARGIIFPHLRSSTGLILESVASSAGAAAASAKTGFGFAVAESPSELIANPGLDAVFILTRHDSHAGYVKDALERGKLVFVEKPLAIHQQQLEMLRAAYAQAQAENRSPFVMVGFNRRFSPLTEKLQSFFRGRTEPMLVHIRCNAGFIPRTSWIQAPENGGRIIGELCHFVDWARAVIAQPIRTVTAAALPDAARYSRDNVTVTLSFEDGSVANLVYVANGDRAVAKEYCEVFCGGAIARLNDFKTLALSRDNKTEHSKCGQDKGHRRQVELTVQAMKQGKDAPIPFAELCEVTEATFAIEEAIRTQTMVSLDAGTAYPRENQTRSGELSRGVDSLITDGRTSPLS
jgi:predicted dehydrogenase/threonine dehydrogenase-like Zn-dependent dehydrogenase